MALNLGSSLHIWIIFITLTCSVNKVFAENKSVPTSSLQKRGSRTFYIDWDAGVDTNDGLSKQSPWKRHPYMSGFAGTYTHQAGDHAIFKGSVVWPSSCFPMSVSAGGSDTNSYDYYGVDFTWFSGSAWTRPIFDFGGQDKGYDIFISVWNPSGAPHHIIFDNFEMRNLYWSGAKDSGWVAFFNVHSSEYITIKNMYMHGWSHGSYAAGTRDSLFGVLGDSNAPYNNGGIVDSCIFDGSFSNGDSGAFVYLFPCVTNSVVRHATNGIIGAHVVVGNDISFINLSFDSGEHTNALESLGGVNIYANNVIHDSIYCEPWLNQGNEITYFFNNIFYNQSDTKSPLQFDTLWGPGASLYVFNNIFYTPGPAAIRGLARSPSDYLTSVTTQNNIVITDYQISSLQITVNNLVEDHNLVIGTSQATALGFTRSNNFLPPSSYTAYRDVGVDLSSVIAGVPDSIAGVSVVSIKQQLSKDIKGVPRPQGSSWDLGAYEYTTSITGGSSTGHASTGAPIVSLTSTGLPLVSLAFDATAMVVIPPMKKAASFIYQDDITLAIADAGTATYPITIATAGNYIITAKVNCSSGSFNSVYINIDTVPTNFNVWHIILTNGFEWRTVSFGGNTDPTFASPNTNQQFALSPGQHTVIVKGREPHTEIQEFQFDLSNSSSSASSGSTATTFSPTAKAQISSATTASKLHWLDVIFLVAITVLSK